MAIETNTDYAESETPAEDQQEPAEEGYEPFDAPLSSLGDVKEGEIKSVKVVSVDEGTGMATLQCNHPEKKMGGGIKEMASAFKPEP